MKLYSIPALLLLMTYTTPGKAQQQQSATPATFSLEQCLQYAYEHSPALQQSLLDQRIAEHGIKSKLADWYPQIRFDYNVQHAFQLQVSNFNGQIIPLGLRNTSAGQFSLTQNIFSSDALLASNSAKEVRKQASQNVVLTKIDLSVNVGKAFYDVLLTRDQLRLLDEDIVRLDRSLTDSYNQYEGGIVDKVDYKRATIALNNTKAQKKSATEALKAKYSFLKLQMGLPDSIPLQLSYDSSRLETLAIMDTSAAALARNRVEYQQLETQKRLQDINYNYYKWQFIPTVQAYGNYNLNYLNNDLDKLYRDNYPNSFAGLRVGIPLFQGFKRVQNMKQAKLQSDRVNYDLEQMRNSISTEVSQAMAAYKGYLNDFYTLRQNVAIAQEVFNTIELQYRSGIKAYLEVITAQTDLRTAELNYSNALYQLLGSKLDLERALGVVQVH
ncbi:TolC family protein [Taibaiella koreensis]|uniref:TolC family protein n=1 Tax=Taibaiella koreensis TaxID=1268548 RepID=UPI000E59F843|nr:TolC family protein [Taibaiella koreensis]